MIVSLMKTKVLVCNKKKHCDEVFTVGGNIIEIADEYRYLGFIFNTRSNDAVGTMPDYLIGQARKATYQARELRIETGDRMGYAVLAIKMLFWRKYTPYNSKI